MAEPEAPAASANGEGGEHDPDHSADPVRAPELPYVSVAADPGGASLTEPAIDTITDEMDPPVDDGEPPDPDRPPTTPPAPLPTPAQTFAGTDPRPDTSSMSPADAAAAMKTYDARAQVRRDGSRLLDIAGTGTPESAATRRIDRAAAVFRANLGEFWAYSRSSIEDQIGTLQGAKARLAVLQGVLTDGKLLDALTAFANARAAATTDWPLLAATAHEVTGQLTELRGAITGAYKQADSLEAALGTVLDGIGREVAREINAQFLGGPVDLGTRYTGVIYAVRLGSVSQAEADAAAATLAQRKPGVSTPRPADYLMAAFGKAIDATKAAHGAGWVDVRGTRPTKWATDLIASVGAWSDASLAWAPGGDIDGFTATSRDLLTKLAAARDAITNAKPPLGARRVIERALDGITTAIANQIDALGANSVPVKARLGPIAVQLRRTVTGVPAATDPLSSWWKKAQAAGLKPLSSADARSLKAWLDPGFPNDLVSWSKQMGKVPNHDPDQLQQDSWSLATTLNRYRIAIDGLATDEGARQLLLDSVDALSQQISARLQKAAIEYGPQL
jgi:hypothetical protein